MASLFCVFGICGNRIWPVQWLMDRAEAAARVESCQSAAQALFDELKSVKDEYEAIESRRVKIVRSGRLRRGAKQMIGERLDLEEIERLRKILTEQWQAIVERHTRSMLDPLFPPVDEFIDYEPPTVKYTFVEVPEDPQEAGATELMLRRAKLWGSQVETITLFDGTSLQLPKPKCHSNGDGDCIWAECPQLRDGEPARSGRHCPIDTEDDDDDD